MASAVPIKIPKTFIKEIEKSTDKIYMLSFFVCEAVPEVCLDCSLWREVRCWLVV
jgi:hypothetical protein